MVLLSGRMAPDSTRDQDHPPSLSLRVATCSSAVRREKNGLRELARPNELPVHMLAGTLGARGLAGQVRVAVEGGLGWRRC